MPDPFSVLNAELATPSEIAREFIKDHTEYTKISAHEHTLIWGSRGSGKTMHIRVLEPAAWIEKNCAAEPADGFRRFLESANGFIGVYINCRDAVLNRQEFRIIDKGDSEPTPFLLTLADRYLAQAILDRLGATFLSQLGFFSDVRLNVTQLPVGLRTRHYCLPNKNLLLRGGSIRWAALRVNEIMDAARSCLYPHIFLDIRGHFSYPHFSTT